MPISMYQASAPRFVNTLTNLSAILDKAQAHAEAKKIDPAALIDFRLYPDMLPMKRQVQIACDTAKGAVARLAGVEVPKHEDKEETFAELKARIANPRGRLQGNAVPARPRDPEFLLPRDDRLRHPAPQRRRARQARLPRQPVIAAQVGWRR